MDFSLPGYLGDIDDFRSAYDNDVDAAKRIEPLISPLMLRRRVSEVAQDLPERIDIPEIIELSEKRLKNMTGSDRPFMRNTAMPPLWYH